MSLPKIQMDRTRRLGYNFHLEFDRKKILAKRHEPFSSIDFLPCLADDFLLRD